MPMDYIHNLRYLINKHKDDDKTLKEAEALEDTLDQI